jgi:hypothetical protein
MRKLLDGREVPELEEPKTLTVHTKCPEKWILIDTETGEVYNGHVTDGKNSWMKTKDSLKWTPPNA